MAVYSSGHLSAHQINCSYFCYSRLCGTTHEVTRWGRIRDRDSTQLIWENSKENFKRMGYAIKIMNIVQAKWKTNDRAINRMFTTRI